MTTLNIQTQESKFYADLRLLTACFGEPYEEECARIFLRCRVFQQVLDIYSKLNDTEKLVELKNLISPYSVEEVLRDEFKSPEEIESKYRTSLVENFQKLHPSYETLKSEITKCLSDFLQAINKTPELKDQPDAETVFMEALDHCQQVIKKLEDEQTEDH